MMWPGSVKSVETEDNSTHTLKLQIIQTRCWEHALPPSEAVWRGQWKDVSFGRKTRRHERRSTATTGWPTPEKNLEHFHGVLHENEAKKQGTNGTAGA